jgi:hypothetical protein
MRRELRAPFFMEGGDCEAAFVQESFVCVCFGVVLLYSFG